jgi:hypothetical protein
MVSLNPPEPSALARPIRAMMPSKKISVVRYANDLEWLKPSAYRSLMNASLISLQRPVRSKVCRASSPVSPHVSGT